MIASTCNGVPEMTKVIDEYGNVYDIPASVLKSPGGRKAAASSSGGSRRVVQEVHVHIHIHNDWGDEGERVPIACAVEVPVGCAFTVPVGCAREVPVSCAMSVPIACDFTSRA